MTSRVRRGFGMFWSWPLVSTVRFENSVSQARDLLAAERNFLAGVRAAFTIAVAAATLAFKTGVESAAWEDWVLSGLLLAVALSLPFTSLYNYSAHFNAQFLELAEIHNSNWLLFTLLFTSVCSVLVAAREYTK